MGKEIITFGKIELKKDLFYRKNHILLKDVDINNMQDLLWFILVKKL